MIDLILQLLLCPYDSNHANNLRVKHVLGNCCKHKYGKYASYWLLPLKFSDMINSRASKVGNPIRYFLGSLLWKAGSIVCKFSKANL